MEVNEALNIINSDFQLWSKAEQLQEGQNLTLTIVLPWNIGRRSITFEGVANAEAKRNAMSMFGSWVRDLVANATDDEAVESRAAQKAALAGPADSADSVGDDEPVPEDASPEEEAEESPAGAYEGAIVTATDQRATLTARRAEIQRELESIDREFDAYHQELQLIEAMLEAVDKVKGANP